MPAKNLAGGTPTSAALTYKSSFLKTCGSTRGTVAESCVFQNCPQENKKAPVSNQDKNVDTELGFFPEVLVLPLWKPESPSTCEDWVWNQEFSWSDVLILYSFGVLK